MEYRYLLNGQSLAIDSSKCSGCGICREVCPHNVFTDTVPVTVRDPGLCMECGACALNCPRGAIRVNTGVGCAAAIINGMLGRKGSDCCCSCESGSGEARKQNKSPCC